MAATGEYTQFHGGTVADALAAIAVTMNRVNGIYERDLAVRLVLVANNDLVIYTDAATDPYTNNSASAAIAQKQVNLDQVIGSANYDIGHLVSTGAGGLATLGSPCNTAIKARGVTGQANPAGDPFDVDFVAHEIGHQFNGHHSFNSLTGSCGNTFQRIANTAYEPGSGTTIMAYAGICGADNIQPNSDNYFHAKNLEEIVAFISGAGKACAVSTNSGNTPPTADAGPVGIAYTIPRSTPFELTGAGIDADGDSLTYTWEQYDLGTKR